MLVVESGRPSELLELCYWSREPGAAELMRSIVAMPDETRAAFEAFLALAGNPKTIEAELSGQGVLTLTSPEVPKAIALATYVAENDREESARTFN
jgi:hypothetical protein